MMENLHLPLDLIAEETMRLGQELTDSNETDVEAIKKRMQEYLKHDEYCDANKSMEYDNSIDDTSDSQNSIENNDNQDMHEMEEAMTEVLPEKAGIIFRICESAGTYIVRSIIADNISETMQGIQKDFSDKEYKKLRLEEKDDTFSLRYFRTENMAQAEVLHEHFSNRRLPKDEDVLCNISDPGFSWWLDTSPGNIKIYFKSHGVECSSTFLKLGPLSDINIFKKRMAKLNKIIDTCTNDIAVHENDSYLSISCSQTNQLFKDFRGLLLEGRLEVDSTLMGIAANDLTMNLFLKEITIVRRFWIEIDMILNSNQKVQ